MNICEYKQEANGLESQLTNQHVRELLEFIEREPLMKWLLADSSEEMRLQPEYETRIRHQGSEAIWMIWRRQKPGWEYFYYLRHNAAEGWALIFEDPARTWAVDIGETLEIRKIAEELKGSFRLSAHDIAEIYSLYGEKN